MRKQANPTASCREKISTEPICCKYKKKMPPGVRSKNWSYEENMHLAMAWVQASEDPVAGIDQTSNAFRSTLLKAFHALDPTGTAGVAGAYALREKQPSRNHFSQMSADCSKFHTAYRCKCDGRWVLTTCTGDNSEDACDMLRATSSHLDNRVDALRTAVHLRNGAGWRRGWNLENRKSSSLGNAPGSKHVAPRVPKIYEKVPTGGDALTKWEENVLSTSIFYS
jgi:hypothetical protein